jgi:hypothetical protein
MSTNNDSSSSGGDAAEAVASATNAAILNRLKEIENNNQMMQGTIDRLNAEAQMKEDKIKTLSAEKRRDMEQMIETAIDTWLNSLTGVPEEVRKQFRHGISKIAEQADMKNAAWEVIYLFLSLFLSSPFLIFYYNRLCATHRRRITATSSKSRRSSAPAPSKGRQSSR